VRKRYFEDRQPKRIYKDFTYRILDSWSRSRRVIGKAEYVGKGENPRFIVTNLLRSEIEAGQLYEGMCTARGVTWRTGLKNSSCICSPTGPLRRPRKPINCVCIFPASRPY